MVLFPFTLLQIMGKKKKVWKRRKGEDEEMGLGNDVMGLPMCVRVFM